MVPMYQTDGDLTDEGQEAAANAETPERPQDLEGPCYDNDYDAIYGDADESAADYSVEETNPKETEA